MKRLNRKSFLSYQWHFRRIDGWIHPFTAWFMFEISHAQSALGIVGSVAEIGVHHGKSFIPMYLGIEDDESAVAIDVFEMQEFNRDGSGKGDRLKFLSNLKRVAGTEDGLRIIARPSESVTQAEIMEESGRIRLFSIDGSHTDEATYADLNLAAGVLSNKGAIVLDDLFNELYPEVVGGTYRFLRGNTNIVPIIIIPGKIILCERQSAQFYKDWCIKQFAGWVDFKKSLFSHEVLGVGLNGNFIRRRFRNTTIGGRISLLKRKLASSGFKGSNG